MVALLRSHGVLRTRVRVRRGRCNFCETTGRLITASKEKADLLIYLYSRCIQPIMEANRESASLRKRFSKNEEIVTSSNISCVGQ